jgi:hypothetical protein
MQPVTVPAATTSMAERQGATPPAWLGRSWVGLLFDVIGGPRQNWDKLVQLAGLLVAFFRPGLLRRRLERLRALGHIEVIPNMRQLLVAGRDQMIVSATQETKVFYKSQGIPWVFHNLRRFISGPATMLDPIGLFSPREVIVHHVLQTFHRHPLYDLVLLRAHEGGVEAMTEEAAQILAGTHPHQRALASLIEDGAYHQRLARDIREFADDPHMPARSVPNGLLSDKMIMLAMEQFKDIGGYARYASRLNVGWWQVLKAWLCVGFDETIGDMIGVKLGPTQVRKEACDPDIVREMLPPAN